MRLLSKSKFLPIDILHLKDFSHFVIVLDFCAMSTDEVPYDYSGLATSYMSYFVDAETLLTFLKTRQTGFAHSARGTDIAVLMKHLVTSLSICILEILLFSSLRIFFTHIYRPVIIELPSSKKNLLKMFGWFLPAWKQPTSDYLTAGLDGYFFVRFLDILLFFFMTCGIFNVVVLIPVNYWGNSDLHHAAGIDRLSLSNIALSKVSRLNAHLICSLTTILVFHVVILRELQSTFEIRQKHLTSKAHRNKTSSNILLVGDVPKKYRDVDKLHSLFSAFPGGLEKIWFTDNYMEFWWQSEKAYDALNILEDAQVRDIRSTVRAKKSQKGPITPNSLLWPLIFFPLIKIPLLDRTLAIRLPGLFRAIAFQSRIFPLEFCVQVLSLTYEMITQRRLDLEQLSFEKQSKVFLKFHNQEAVYLAYQSLLSSELWTFDHSLAEVLPSDIIWENVIRKNSTFTKIEKCFLCAISILAIVFYVIPVSLITLLSQIPIFTQLFPFMALLTNLPYQISEVLSSLLPAVLLSILTEIQLHIFQGLIHWKGKWTGSEEQLDLQRWYFAFLFIQHFLVVTILSSIIVLLVQAVEKPASIPILLAANVPKSATFFFKYLAVKAFSMCGSSFLQISRLILHLVYYPFVDTTPRLKLKRYLEHPTIKWGSVYPLISVYGSIGITYSVISPIISFFMIFIFLLFLLYYKYALHEVYLHENISETYGKLYPRALFQLYTGVYCLEFCMIGLFFALRNSSGECPMKFQGLLMIFVLVITIFGHFLLKRRFCQHFKYVPALRETEERQEPDVGREADVQYLHPCYSYQKPKLWLPNDSHGESAHILRKLTAFTNAFSGGTTENAEITAKGKLVVQTNFKEETLKCF